MNPAQFPKAMLLAACLLCHPLAQADEQEIETEVMVKTAPIVQATLQRYVSAYGLAEPALASLGKADASSKVAAPVAGIIAKIYCQEGEQVKKGAPLFELDSRAADAQIARAQVTYEFAQKNYARKQLLNPGETISRKLLDDAQQLLATARTDLATAQTQRDLLTINSPLSGTVSIIHFKVGEAVSTSSVLVDMLDAQRLEIVMHIPSQEATSLRLGQALTFNTGNKGDGEAATLDFISPQIDPLTDTVLVRALPQPKRCVERQCLRPGQALTARIVVETRQQRLAVPVASVVTADGSSTIAIVEGDKAKRYPVVTGLRDSELIEVSGEGLQPGMTVVTEGTYGLPAETRIRVQK